MPGPLTSAMSTSRIVRAVHNNTARSESAGYCITAAGSRLDGSISSDTSSGVVDSPDVRVKEGEHLAVIFWSSNRNTHLPGPCQCASGLCASTPEQLCLLTDDLYLHADSQLLELTHERSCDAAVAAKQQGKQQQEPCSSSSSRLTDGAFSSGPLSARLHRHSSAGGVCGATPMRPSSSSAGGADGADVHIEMAPLSARRREQQLQQQLGVGPKGSGTPRMPHSRPQLPPKHRSSTSSLHKALATATDVAAVAAAASCSAGCVAAAAQQVVSPQARRSSADRGTEEDAERAASQMQASPHAGDAEVHVTSSSGHTAQQSTACTVGVSCGDLASSKVSLHGSYSKLQLSHEDIPLMAIKPTPGRLPRGLDSSRSGKASLTSSWQQRCSSDKQLIPASSLAAEQSAVGNNGDDHAAAQPAGVPVMRQCNPQYATMQSDMCNFASWLGGAGPSTSELHAEASNMQQTQQHQKMVQLEQQLSRGPSVGSSRAGSSLDEQDYPPPAPQDSDSVIIGELSVISPVNSVTSKGAAAALCPAAVDSVAVAGQQAAGAGVVMQAGKGRFRMSDWAYMSDLCNLGGSFDVAGGGSGLAAALGRLAEEGYESPAASSEIQPEQQQAQPSNTPAALTEYMGKAHLSNSSSSQQQQQSFRVRAASGSWPDANPSPASTQHLTLDSRQVSLNSGVAAEAAAVAVTTADAAIDSLTSAAAAGMGVQAAEAQGATVPAAEAAGTKDTAIRNSSTAGCQLDPAMLAAVTGTSDTKQLTASQEELAAKLAKLAFANPAARKPSNKQQSKQQQQGVMNSRQGTALAGAAARVPEEPFYPTMMSDMCNLAEPLSEEDELEQDNTDEDTGKSTPQLLAEARAATTAQRNILQSVHHQHPPYRKQFKPAGHINQHRASIQRKSQLKAGRSVAAGPLRSALLMRHGPGAAPRPDAARAVSGVGAAGATAAVPDAAECPARSAAPGAAGYPLESFDSYYPDCDLNPSASDVPSAVTGGGADAAASKVTYVNPYYLYRDSTTSSLVTGNTVGGSPPKSPKRAVKSGHVAAAVAALECQSAAATAAEEDEVESDLHAEWQQDKSRPSSPAVGVASPKGRWAVVDASLEARER